MLSELKPWGRVRHKPASMRQSWQKQGSLDPTAKRHWGSIDTQLLPESWQPLEDMGTLQSLAGAGEGAALTSPISQIRLPRHSAGLPMPWGNKGGGILQVRGNSFECRQSVEPWESTATEQEQRRGWKGNSGTGLQSLGPGDFSVTCLLPTKEKVPSSCLLSAPALPASPSGPWQKPTVFTFLRQFEGKRLNAPQINKWERSRDKFSHREEIRLNSAPGRTRPESHTAEPKQAKMSAGRKFYTNLTSPKNSSSSLEQISFLVMLPHVASTSTQLYFNFQKLRCKLFTYPSLPLGYKFPGAQGSISFWFLPQTLTVSALHRAGIRESLVEIITTFTLT